jgi:hypothetical protein
VAPTDIDRRTVLTRHELLGADPRGHRAVLDEVKGSLEDLDDRTRRKGMLLVSALAVQWSALTPGPGEKMMLRIDRDPDRLRIAASASEDALPVAFWEVVGGAAGTAFADSCEIAPDRSGAWFDIERIGP